MKLEKIFIRNFRPIGEKGLKLTFPTACTTIVGENNIGKSSILEAIKKLLSPNVVLETEDWYAGDKSKTIEIKLECVLEDEQIKNIIELLDLPFAITEYRKNFTDKLVCEYRNTAMQSSLLFKLGEVCIEGNTGWIGEINRNLGYTHADWEIFLRDSKFNENLIPRIKKFLEQSQSSSPSRIIFRKDVSNSLSELLKQSIIIIEEFREKPQNSLSEFLISPTGKELASVLFNLKNARSEQNEKFKQIQENFHKLFPNLEIGVIREIKTKEIKILTKKAGIESTTFYLGAGVLESLLLLTHLIAHSDRILCIDHPELHLHPHAQRRLGSFIEKATDNQVLIITHSPYFININKNSGIRRAIQKNEQIEIIEPPQNYFEDVDFFKLEQFLDIDAKELFFSRKVFLVEGPTEVGALPIFASSVDYDFDENGVSVINVGGKKNFEFFVKLCEGFQIPYFVVADKDADLILTKIKERHPDCKSYVLPAKFDDLLPKALREEATRLVGESKPRIGRYVARKMLEENTEVPKDIRKIIDEIKGLDGG